MLTHELLRVATPQTNIANAVKVTSVVVKVIVISVGSRTVCSVKLVNRGR